MNKLKKMVSAIISLSLMITTLPVNSFSASYPVLPQYDFSNFAKITSANFCENSDTTVINIQDLHNNKEVQDNICKLLEKLNSQCENLDVYIEGASIPIDYNELSSSMTKEEVSVLMNALYANDKLSGAEFFGYQNNKVLKPTEQKNIYDENIQNYSFLIKNKQKINELLNEKYTKIRRLDDYLEKEQRKTLKFYNAYLNKKISSEQFYGKILQELNRRKISTLRYINTKLYLDILNANKTINQKAAERQLQTVVTNLKNTITYQEYVNLLQDSKNLSDINVIFAYLSANIKDSDKITKYPDLFRLISLRELSSLINPLELIEEENQMMEDILLSYSKTTGNKDVVFINLFFQIYKKLLLASISSNEYVYYKQNYKNFVRLYSKYVQNDDLFNLYRYLVVAENFNELNIQRNITFVNSLVPENKNDEVKNNYRGKFYNINKILSGLNKIKNIKVIISGGFHTEGINELLKAKKVSYITLTPNVKETDSLYEQNYLDSIVEQAEVDINAISKKPFSEQARNIIADNIVSSLGSILEQLKTKSDITAEEIEQINKIIEDIIKANEIDDIVQFDINSNGTATVTVEGKVYTLNYKTGTVKSGDSFATTLAKNIKILIKEAFKNPSIRSFLVVNAQDKRLTKTVSGEYVRLAEELLMNHNILLPGITNYVLEKIFLDHDTNGDINEYEVINSALENVAQSEFANAEIIVSKTGSLFGVTPDGYGKTEEYGSLFYVVWNKNASGNYEASRILISDVFLKYLEDQGYSKKELEEVFRNIFIHERLEMLALTGQSESFNKYVLSHKLSATSDSFHKYIKSVSFKNMLAEYKMSPNNHEKQKSLLNVLDNLISSVNRENSEYSDVISVSSLEDGNEEYTEDVVEAFLSIRAGDNDIIANYNEKLIAKIVSLIDNLIGSESYKDENQINDLIDNINSITIAYRKESRYIMDVNFAKEIKEALAKNFDIPSERVNEISINVCEIQEKDGELVFSEDVDGKMVFLVDDIISRRSNTFNKIYTALNKQSPIRVQGAAFFDLSKEEDKKNVITEQAFERIKQEPQILVNLIKKLNGNVQKYFSLYLVRLLNDSAGEEILKQIYNLDKTTIGNLMTGFIDMLNNNNLPRDVNPYDIIDLILFMEYGEKKDAFDLDKSDIDALSLKYNFKVKKGRGNAPLAANYGDWQGDIEKLIIYARMLGYEYIDLSGITNINQINEKRNLSNKDIIEQVCSKFDISFVDRKTKSKRTHFTKVERKYTERIKKQERKLSDARDFFEKRIKKIDEQFGITKNRVLSQEEYEDYLRQIDFAGSQYRSIVREVMLSARDITVEVLSDKGMNIDTSLFMIVVGGSLVKGNMMSDSDIYYDIIVPDGSISKSIQNRFAPLYSSILQQVGLTNYHVLKYSSTDITRANFGTFIDEKEIATFLNYAPLSQDDTKKKMYFNYMMEALKKASTADLKKDTKDKLGLITEKYFAISSRGKGWFGNSFQVAHDETESFSDRWTLLALQSKLNEIMFDYYVNNIGAINVLPVSIEEQITFIKRNIAKTEEEQQVLDNVHNAWKFLASCRNIKSNNKWTGFLALEKQAVDTINTFVSEGTNISEDEPVGTINTPKELLSVIETFFNDNYPSEKIRINSYDKYDHLDKWKEFVSGENAKITAKNRDIFIRAQIIALLIEIDSPEIRNKLRELGIPKEELNFIISSLDSIKIIDRDFPDYYSIQGERSMQNYWDGVAVTAQNPETVFALIAHKLTSANFIDVNDFENEDDFNAAKKNAEILLHSVYLPLSKRFGNPAIYEYVRNDSFECSHPAEYLNLLNIIETLYGIPYSQLRDYNDNLRDVIVKYLEDNDFQYGKDFEIKTRVKSLYSIYEKLNSARKNDEDLKALSDIEKPAAKYILNSKEPLFDEILQGVNYDRVRDLNVVRQRLINLVDANFDTLSIEDKKLLNDFLGQMKNAVFANYKVVNRIKGTISGCLPNSLNDDGYVDIEKLGDNIKALSEEEKFLNLWFLDMFGEELRDLVGLHVVAQDEKYADVVNALEKDKEKDPENPYSALVNFFLKTKGMLFQYFNKDLKNKQARLKINAAINLANGVPIPVEVCFYEQTDYDAETYGIYNYKKISAPHYIYKMGKNFDALLFEDIFSKELDYSFIDKSQQEKKRMVFTSDGVVPGEDLAENFRDIFEKRKLDGTITCFVEYDGAIYVQKLQKGATIFDLATGRNFSDDVNVSVYTDRGDMLSSNVLLDNARLYKIIKAGDSAVSVPRTDKSIKTKRGKVVYQREKNEIGSDVSAFFKSIKSAGGNVHTVTDLLEEILTNEKIKEILIDEKKGYSEKAKAIYNEKTKSDNIILQNEQLITDFIMLLSDLISEYNLGNISLLSFIKRSTQIANHYDFANMFELFEAIDYGIIDFNDIEAFYNMCVVIKTKMEISNSKLLEAISTSGLDIEFVPANSSEYNLMINKEKFFISGIDLIDYRIIETIIGLLQNGGIKTAQAFDKDDKRIDEEEDTVFVAADFVQPKKEFSLMSLGNSVEQLVRYAMVHHSRIVSAILEKTHEIAHKYEITQKTDESMDSLTQEESGLMAQILMGIFSRDSYYDKRYEDTQNLLAQETPYLTQEDIDIIKDIEHLDLSEYADLMEKFGIDEKQIIERFKGINFKVSRSFDLQVDSRDMFSFATIGIDPVTGTETLFMSEALLREISNSYPEEEEAERTNKRQILLRQAVIHELIEKAILDLQQIDTGEEQYNAVNYEKIHELFEQYEGQKTLMDFIRNTAVPNTLHLKEALFDEIDSIMEQSDTTETDAKSTIALMFGNLNIDSFINTYRAYRDKKVGRIFISGNTRGSLAILKILRDVDNHPEFKPFLDGIVQGGDISSVRTVKDLLSLPKEEFEKLTPKDLEALPKRSSEVSYLKEEKTGPVSKEEIFELVSKDGVTEAAIIKWIMLESARQDAEKYGFTRKDINNLIRSISLETDAANTLQNIENIFSQQEFLNFISEQDNIDIVIVQNPFSQLRAKATLNKYLHSDRRNAATQNKTFNIHTMKFDDNSLDYYTTTEKMDKSIGEWARLIAYTLKGDIYPVIGEQEGLNAIPLEALLDNLHLMAALNDAQKKALAKVFEDVAKQNDSFKSFDDLLTLLKEQNLTANHFNLISDFIKYLYSDTTEQRLLERKWANIKSVQEIPQVDLEQELSLENRMETMQSILSAA
ncbi:MAG: hypothetical protein IKN62_07810 [Elusimicrobia bacterium]|nr:hypothetical protein [Elusimicrobiota bacterium]